ncbi:hypothetical protein DFJ58DRAFT_632493, partial [Suillus subalutaceus]|uniref:uncharacterized protein n=1 Tax=Suillus subalutaceus TaxID=48586 RepID=UPI001B879218
HCLFLSAFMLTSTVICDDTYSNKTWSIVVQSMFQLCKLTRWSGNMSVSGVRAQSRRISRSKTTPLSTTNLFPPPPAALNFVGQEPYPTYILPSSSK